MAKKYLLVRTNKEKFMKISLIICTYMRPEAICVLLDSVVSQTKIPNEIIIVDGSTNTKTKEILELKDYKLNIRYFLVEPKDRGLTRQRNFGVNSVEVDMDLLAFLDDDIRLEKEYFEELTKPYLQDKTVVGVGGCTTNEIQWYPFTEGMVCTKKIFCMDGFFRNESLRYRMRKLFNLVPSTQPGIKSKYSHERPVAFLPPSGKHYEVDFMMGGIASFKQSLFKEISFSHYFEGYGLYEDKDFTLRASKIGKLIVNTDAKLEHLHDPNGRPNKFYYGKMVIRNGWYVWRVACDTPGIKGILQWYSNALLLIAIRFTNIITGPNRIEALTETSGRIYGLLTLLVSKPRENK